MENVNSANSGDVDIRNLNVTLHIGFIGVDKTCKALHPT
jgi:hypothetical protein